MHHVMDGDDEAERGVPELLLVLLVPLPAACADRALHDCSRSERLAALPLVREPGTGFSYGVSTLVVGRLIEVASGLPLEEAMERLFGRWTSECKIVYASKVTKNPHLAIVGTVEAIVSFLRHQPGIQKMLGIVKMQPDGFTVRVTVGGKFLTFKQFGMVSDGTPQVAYVKAGYETMACVKPLDLFHYDCAFGHELTSHSEMFQDHKPASAEAMDAHSA